MTRLFKSDGRYLLLSGDTFSVRDHIKMLGGRWDPANKSWKVANSPDLVEKIMAMGFSADRSLTGGALGGTEILTLDPSAAPPISTGPQLPRTVGKTAERVWSVGDFVNYVSAVFAAQLSFSFWLCGEISSLKKSNGHVYFDLSEQEDEVARNSTLRASSVSCCLWAGKYRALCEKNGDLPLSEGLKIKVLVHCEFRKESGRINVIVDDIDLQYTMGDLAMARQNMVRELRKRGLYDRNRTTFLSPLPMRIALVTAATSRAASDFLDELKVTGLAFVVTLFDCNMQGENTSTNVCNALREIAEPTSKTLSAGNVAANGTANTSAFDCIVVTRGGGSRLDLRWFDDLEIAKAIAYSPLPVLTAIGHFEDVSVADEVAFKAEKTPTGAARYLGHRVLETMQSVFNRAELAARKATRRLLAQRQFLLQYEQKIAFSARKKITNAHHSLSSCEQTIRLIRLTLEKTLHRGFALVKTDQGLLLKASDFLGTTRPQTILVELFDSATSTEVTLQAQVLKVRTDSWDS